MPARALGGFVLVLFVCVCALRQSASGQPSPDETDLDLDGEPGVAAPPANAQPAAPSILAGTGSMLIDRSHREYFDTSGFIDFLSSAGWIIAEHSSGPITEAVLAGHDILLIPTRSTFTMTPFSPDEVSAIQSFLSGGSGLWVLSDNVDPDPVNTLSIAFGVTFQFDYVQDPTNNEGGFPPWPTIYLLTPHSVTAGVQSYTYYGGDCLAALAPAQIVGRADEDAYSYYCPAGSMPPTLAVWENGGGRAVFAGDITPLAPTYYPDLLRPEEQLLLQNIVNWLLGPPPNAASQTSWGRIKALHREIEPKN